MIIRYHQPRRANRNKISLRVRNIYSDLAVALRRVILLLINLPMEESLPPEHGGELFGDSFEEFLDGRRVADERRRHFQAARRNVTHGSLLK